MLFGRKKKMAPVSYDRNTQRPAIRASICTGEKVGGLQDLKTGEFTELMFLRGDEEVEAFREACGVDRLETIY